MRMIPWLMVVAALLAGCLGALDQDSDAAPEGPETGAQAPSVAALANVSSEKPGAEPVVDVASDGTIYVQGLGFHPDEGPAGAVRTSFFRSSVFRSTDGGASWEDVSPPDTGRWDTGDGFVAVGPDDTVYAANAYGRSAFQEVAGQPVSASPSKTFQLSRSGDGGDTWERLTPPQPPNRIHRMWIVPSEDGTLHVTLASLGASPDTRPLWYLRSDDGGETWTQPVLVHPQRSFGSDLVLGPDGTLSIAIWTPAETPAWTLMRSSDRGASWEAVPAEGLTNEGAFASSWQSLTVDPDRTLYLAWVEEREGRTQLIYAVSSDGGEHWSTPVPIAPSKSDQMLGWIEARGAGELVAVWYAAGDAAPGESTPWHGAFARIAGADTDDPSIQRLELARWPVHQGPICQAGTCAGQGGENTTGRELLDFTWVTVGPSGRAHAALASTQWDRPGAFPVHASIELPARSR